MTKFPEADIIKPAWLWPGWDVVAVIPPPMLTAGRVEITGGWRLP